MNSIEALKKRQSRAPQIKELLFVTIAYIFGLGLCFLLCRESDIQFADKLFSLETAYFPAVALLLLLLLQLAAFSLLGAFFVPLIGLLSGFMSLLYIGTIMPDSPDVLKIIDLLAILFIFIFAALLVSCSSFRSSLRIAKKLSTDKRLKLELIKLVVLITAFCSSLIFGLTDINILT